MYRLIQSMTLKQLLLEQAPTLGASLLVAELYYKFHSFTLECVAFLATWYVLDAASQLLKHSLNRAFVKKSVVKSF